MRNTDIQRTANTLFDLRDHSDFKYCNEIADFLKSRSITDEIRISTENFMALVVSRFATTQALLEQITEKYGTELQIVELGSGFTPHCLNLSGKIRNYIEVDLPDNSELKKEISKNFVSTNNQIFVAGDILDGATWQKISANIEPDKPVLIFSEGVIAQYFSAEQKEKIASFAKSIMKASGSCFVIDDTLRNHQEFHSNPMITEGMNRISMFSGSMTYTNKKQSFADEMDRWSKLFNNKLYTVSYLLSKPEMDFVLKQFKLIVCANDDVMEESLQELSTYNLNNRIWK